MKPGIRAFPLQRSLNPIPMTTKKDWILAATTSLLYAASSQYNQNILNRAESMADLLEKKGYFEPPQS